MTENVDFISRVISATIPATVAECARRFGDIYALRNKPSELMGLVEKVSGELIAECDFDVDEQKPDSESAQISTKLASLGVSNSDLGHIQNLKYDLNDLYNEFVSDLKQQILDEIRDDLKAELRMEIFMELEKFKSNFKISTVETASAKKPSTDQPEFNFTIEGISSVSSFDAIADKLSFSAASKNVEADLMNNPLFARVSRGLDRAKQGIAAYTAEELIEARGDRFDTKHIEEFKKRVAESKQDYEEEEEDDEWDRIAREKYSTTGIYR